MAIFVKANNFGLVQTMGGAFIRGSAFIRDNKVPLKISKSFSLVHLR